MRRAVRAASAWATRGTGERMRMGGIAGCLVAALLLAGCSDYGGGSSADTGSPSSALPANVQPGDQLYVAVSGDTVDSVAQLFGVPVQSLIDANHLAPPYELTPGQELAIPHAGASPSGIYTVVAGDTLFHIAREHATTVSALAAANGLQPPYVLKIGQQIQLPGVPGMASASAGTTAPDIALPPAQPAPSLPAASTSGMTTESLAPPPGVSVAPATGSGGAAATAALPATTSSATQALPPPILTPVAPAAAPPSEPTAVAVQPQLKPAVGSVESGAGADAGVLPPPPKPTAVSPIGQATAALGSETGQNLSEPAPRSSGKFFWPVNGKVISPFGPKDGGQHNDGINIAAPLGTPVKAAENGVVVYAGNELRGFGNLLLIRHADGWVSAYAHCDTLLVKRGSQVRRGQVIARVGQTGNVDSPQLHFELRKGAQAVDPMTELAPQGA
jgi:murein DD-endopeptidase MepM/ murein hydrolase activator NlpD